MGARSARRRVGHVALLLVAAATLVSWRVTASGRAAYVEGRRHHASNDPVGARLAYRRAASWWLPGVGAREDALDRLADLAREAEARADDREAMACWRAIRAAIHATSVAGWVDQPSRLALANERIATLRGRGDSSVAELPRSTPGGGALLLFGFALFVAAAFAGARHGMDRMGAPLGTFRGWIGLAFVGFALFLAGLWLA